MAYHGGDSVSAVCLDADGKALHQQEEVYRSGCRTHQGILLFDVSAAGQFGELQGMAGLTRRLFFQRTVGVSHQHEVAHDVV